jgi:tetratricopeptide (TPR) repeat protein
VASLVIASCTPVRPRLDFTPSFAATADLARADALVRAGCYTCLTEAIAIYQTLAAGPTAVPVAAYRAVDTAVLMAMREREIGLGSGRSRQHAEALARELPAPADYSLFLSVIDAVGWKPTGVSPEQLGATVGLFRSVSANLAGWRASLRALAPHDLLSAYQLLSLECLYSYRLLEAKQLPWPLPANAPPLLRASAATCTGAVASLLDDVLRDEPRLRELYLFQGERALGRGALRTAERHLLTAIEEIPALMSAKVVLGHIYLQMEDVESAFAAYHEATTAVPGQRDAMIGEAKALSYLDRSDEAIAVLDEMVRLGTWYLGEAHYWRGWNRLHLKQFDLANDEVAAARKYMPMDPLVDKLSGRVALARNEIERAEREFRTAVEHFTGRQTRDCDTNYYLASVLVMQRKWPEGAQWFSQALPCYVEDEQAARRKIEEINAADLPEERKIRLVTAKQKGIAALQSQQARAAYNAAVAYANLGDKERARPLAERAALHPDMADLARKLLARLQQGRDSSAFASSSGGPP